MNIELQKLVDQALGNAVDTAYDDFVLNADVSEVARDLSDSDADIGRWIEDARATLEDVQQCVKDWRSRQWSEL